MTDDFEELEALLTSGRKAKFAAQSAKERAKAAIEVKETDNQLYANPENWRRGQGIALIHTETQTLLGNFVEYLHLKVPGARKLVREDSPLAVSVVEQVTGSWWLAPVEKPRARESWHEERRCILHTHLGELGLHAPAVSLVVLLEYGGIAKASLAQDTIFAQTEGGEQLVTLPAGTDILRCMTRDCKVKLRMEVGL